MRIVVLRQADEGLGPSLHEADLLETDSRDGELRVTERDRDGRLLSFTLYAAGRWAEARLTEPMSEDVTRHRAQLQERDRVSTGGATFSTGGATFPNGSVNFNTGAIGNSGPY